MDWRVKDLNFAEEGKRKIEWAISHMPVLARIRERLKGERPLSGIRIGACLHVTPETANLLITLKEAGAEVYLSASNPLSTKDDVAASLVKDYGIPVFAIHGDKREDYYGNIERVLSFSPHITLDDGGDLTTYAHEKGYYTQIWGGTEETTTGVIRFKAMEREGALKYPIIAVNEAKTKYLFDNRYGTGQSTIDGILRSTNLLIAGSVFVVCGYGWCGRGVAMRARGMGARVIVTEVDPIKALEAVMDGFEVMPIDEAALLGDFFVTVTGNKKVISYPVIEKMKDGAVLANSGHFDVEIDVESLRRNSVESREVREGVTEFRLKDGKRLYLLSEGRLVNLSAAEGHPPTVMDLSFSNQALAVKYIIEERERLQKRVYTLPPQIDEEIARLKLETMGIKIDNLSEEQRKYLSGWREGT
jgi:adenosylhomocysteinase